MATVAKGKRPFEAPPPTFELADDDADDDAAAFADLAFSSSAATAGSASGGGGAAAAASNAAAVAYEAAYKAADAKYGAAAAVVGVDDDACGESDGELYTLLSAEQRRAVDAIVGTKPRVGKTLLVTGGAGVGKCHARDTPIMMADGRVKLVQDVQCGDKVMGDDSAPRTVLTLARGVDEMYRVTPTKGDAYVVNSAHLLSLKASFSKCGFKKGSTVDISVLDFLALPSSARIALKGFRVPVEFPSAPVPLDPWMMGHWLGDGTSTQPEFTSADAEVVAYYRTALEAMGGVNVHLKNTVSGITWYIRSNETANGTARVGSNPFVNALRETNVLGNKHVPDVYKYNSRAVRLGVLAGIIDSDGHYVHNCYDICLVNERLLDDVIYIARSLGFAAYKTVCQKTCTNAAGGPKTGTYYRTCISGAGLEDIPLVMPYKRAARRAQVKDALVTGITVEPVGRGEYFGFSVDGNNRFLLGDFTVTHNSMCTKAAIQRLKKLGRTIVVTATTGLAAIALEGGRTLHSALRINPDDLKPGVRIEDVVQRVCDNYFFRQEVKAWNTLLIDEVSMLDEKLLTLMDAILRGARDNTDPFGGLQVVLVGDFAQLPPIGERGSKKRPRMLFETDLFWDAVEECHDLKEVWRQSDPAFVALLNRARMGAPSDADVEILYGRVNAKLKHAQGIIPTELFPTNDDVRSTNDKELAKLAGPQLTFKARSSNTPTTKWERARDEFERNAEASARGSGGGEGGGGGGHARKKPRRDVKPPSSGRLMALGFAESGLSRNVCGDKPEDRVVRLKIGAQVSLSFNLDVKTRGLANGSRGVVVGFEPTLAQAQAAIEAATKAWRAARGTPQEAALKAAIPPPPPQPDAEAEFGNFDREEGRLYPDEPLPIVRFILPNGEACTIAVPYVRYMREERGMGSWCVWTLPLRLAWAQSIHKSQGQSLDFVAATLGARIFAPGQAYVALSRARTLAGLMLRAFSREGVTADPAVVSFYSRPFEVSRDEHFSARARKARGEPLDAEEGGGADAAEEKDMSTASVLRAARARAAAAAGGDAATAAAAGAAGAKTVRPSLGAVTAPLAGAKRARPVEFEVCEEDDDDY